MKQTTLLLFFILFIGCKTEEDTKLNFPLVREKVMDMPQKENLWIFLLAGQSNMAGRGFVEPMDTISNQRIISLGQDLEWNYAKEPLHFYEPKLTGLDCGLSFGNELLNHISDRKIVIGLIPCAVGGSSIMQWTDDETHRGVQLLSNFNERLEIAKSQGVIKGILWHQGESDANSKKIPKYSNQIEDLYANFRKTIANDSLPIFVGELGAYKEPIEKQMQWDSINFIINQTADLDENRFVINTKDLTDKGDKVHFDSKSQRELGVRFAKKYVAEILKATKE